MRRSKNTCANADRSAATVNNTGKKLRCAGLLLAVLSALGAFCGCSAGGAFSAQTVEIEPHAYLTALPEVTCVPEPTDEPAGSQGYGFETPEPSLVPETTQGPSDDESLVLSGGVYPLFDGQPLTREWAGESFDVDGDGAKETISVSEYDGGDTLMIDGEPFMDGGLRVSLVSFDGRTMLFCAQKPGDDTLRFFYPDEEGNLYCRLFGFARGVTAEALAALPTHEERVRAGLDIMLHNPQMYSAVDGGFRTVELDMDGDGLADRIVFDGTRLKINGFENRQILSATMPRFAYDAARGSIVLTGSAGDYSLILRLENGMLKEEISYAQLL
ncbi:MAG: hypothetical protein II756_02290 [Clostridia bacterium]|nr:hypothetical protein [Clostridia bacterium]